MNRSLVSRCSVLFLVLNLSLPCVLAKVDIAGVWDSTATTDSETKEYVITIEKDGEGFTGKSVESDGDERKLDRIKIEKNALTIEIDIESDGQTGIIRVVAEEKSSGVLEGKWSIKDDAGTEYMSGEWKAVKRMELDLAGDWDAKAIMADGSTLESVLTITKEEKGYTGKFVRENRETKIEKIAVEGVSVTFDFVIEREGTKRDVSIKSEFKGSQLDGLWHLVDGSGADIATGEWSAVKRAVFDLAGEWAMVGLKPDGGEVTANVIFEKEDDGYKGRGETDDGSLEFTSVTLKDQELKVTFPWDFDGQAAIVTIEASPKSAAELEGTWSVAGADGTKLASAKWKADKKIAKEKTSGVLKRRGSS